jgi:O-antigen ligase
MTSRESPLERTSFWLIATCLGVVQFNLLTAQVLFGVAAICWLVIVVRGRKEGRASARPDVPSWFLPLIVYAVLTLASALASSNRAASLVDCKQLVLFLLVPVVARLARGARAMTAVNVIIALGSAGALVGLVEYYLIAHTDDYRPTGLLSHYMTYSGVLMLVTCTAAARLLFYKEEIVWPAVAVPALLVALVVTRTRNAWIGALAGISTLLGARRPRLLLAIPVLLALFFLLAPGQIRDRAYSIVDRRDPTNLDRLVMVQMGRDIVRDHPWLGVGPDQVKVVYARYREKYPEAVNPTNPHLHNVPVQIAAERGLPALLAWLWFIAAVARDLFRQLRRGQAPAVAAAGLAAVVAMLAAGLFEYNFGDSEFLMLFLGLITLPYAAASGLQQEASGEEDAGGRFSSPSFVGRSPASFSRS